MKQEHTFSGSNNNHLYSRKYLGEGKYYQKGVCKGISVGDTFCCFTEPSVTGDRELEVIEVFNVGDAKGKFNNPDDSKQSFYEAILVDNEYSDKITYKPLRSIGDYNPLSPTK